MAAASHDTAAFTADSLGESGGNPAGSGRAKDS